MKAGATVKIVVFYTKMKGEQAAFLVELIKRHSCGVEAFPVEETWEGRDGMSPRHLFKDASHALFIHQDDPFQDQALLFYSGYCIGRGIRILILSSGSGTSLPTRDGYIGTVLSADTFEDFLQSETVRYETEEKQSRARATLIERGISCFAENFVTTVLSGDEDNAALFLKAGFSPAITDVHGNPLLSLATRAQLPDMVRFLVAAGADVNVQSQDRGYTPLMDATQKGDILLCRMLLESGANPDLRSKDGQTALVIATGRGDIEIAKLLVSVGANPGIADHLGLSALGYARLFKNEALLELFNTVSS